MREKEIERYFTKQVAKAGGKSYKWVSPGNPGVPDRIVLHGGMVFFVELKAPGGKLRATQLRAFRELMKFGKDVWILSSKKDVDEFIRAFLEV